MNIITQEAKKRHAVVKCVNKKERVEQAEYNGSKPVERKKVVQTL